MTVLRGGGVGLPQPSGTGPSSLRPHVSRAQLQASTQGCWGFSVSIFGHHNLRVCLFFFLILLS